jgi:putative addiction module component (TIGR02574 family)
MERLDVIALWLYAACREGAGAHDGGKLMTAAAEQVLKQALGLPPVERAELIQRLFQSFDPSADRRVEAAWSDEVESRIAAFDEGKIAASPSEDVLARINRR